MVENQKPTELTMRCPSCSKEKPLVDALVEAFQLRTNNEVVIRCECGYTRVISIDLLLGVKPQSLNTPAT